MDTVRMYQEIDGEPREISVAEAGVEQWQESGWSLDAPAESRKTPAAKPAPTTPKAG